ncbi:hypothetical protein FHS55_002861 [Angulomicrobium tetraedrale]|uniref:DUF930 domain-containing protein n=1 Tax=Ancylobacter tetraedralis TaxID=217068 RepID=A0A839ZBY6_9HYPH|nr:DUF930 domain-containing protein [Ancylobacter tetraedralis]MBB3772249.1 hypothetical protein [Ancylobacter tetraedralis]
MAPSTAARIAGLALGGLTLFLHAPAQARSENEQMMLLEPSERIEQRCNARAMGEVGRTNKGMKPDELVAYAYRDPVVKGWRIKAPGAAVRSGNIWYHLSYECETEHDGLDVKTFSYKLGAAIPTSEWSGHYLVGQ